MPIAHARSADPAPVAAPAAPAQSETDLDFVEAELTYAADTGERRGSYETSAGAGQPTRVDASAPHTVRVHDGRRSEEHTSELQSR